MNKKDEKSINLRLTLGILGTIAGIILIFGESWFIGVFGSIASAGLAYTAYKDKSKTK